MTVSTEFFVGPAVVVDDKVDEPVGGMADVLDQISAAGMPIVTRKELPPDAEIDHWRGFSLIVLDWELNPVDPGLAGIAKPESLSIENAIAVADFVQELMTRLYCPIFILTNEDVEAIQQELASRLNVEQGQIESRVLVRSKSSVSADLLGVLGKWIREHPAVYALKRWELGYEAARCQMFLDFELSSTQWPRVLWKAAKADDVNPHFELTETISRNILHRFEPLLFEDAVLDVVGDWADSKTALRRVIHRNAVVAQESLHDDVIMPGDFFSVDGEPDAILVNVTPACDLVARSVALDDVQMTLLKGTLLDPSEYSTKTKREKLRAPEGSAVSWVLRSDGKPYRIQFKSWEQATWATHKHHRLGRLLEPYVTLLQQRFALHVHRQGLPSLPEQFYD